MNLSLKDFTIELCDYYIDEEKTTVERPIRLSSLIQGIASTTGVYNEKLTEKENSQYSLTFNIEMFVDDCRNPLIDFVVLGRRLRLKRAGENNIEFIITGKTPTFGNKGISYAITCQDAFSYQFAKQSIKISLNTNDEEQWGEYNTGPKTINELSEKVLELSYLTSWSVNKDINNHIYQFPNNLYFGVEPMKVSLEVNESTPYNIFIEIAKLFNAAIIIDYSKKEINFINREKLNYKGLKLKPEINLSNFSYSEKGDNLYNIMYVSGGEDAYGNSLSIAPSMPRKISKILIESEDIRQKESLGPDWNHLDEKNYYIKPTFVRDPANPHKLYAKAIIDGSYHYVDTGIDKCWEDIRDFDELKGYIMQCYNFIGNAEKKPADIEDMGMFFRKLQRIPHAGNFLCNFDYWRNSKLLSSFRYDNLMELINYRMRNINLKLMALYATYYPIKYELEKLIDQEEEKIHLMAAEDSAMANTTVSQTTAATTRYLSQCEWINQDNPTIDDAYFPIGILDSKDAAKRDVLYGKNIDENLMGYSVPDFTTISSNKNLTYYCIVDGKAEPKTPTYYNTQQQIITFYEQLTSPVVYLKYTDLRDHVDAKSSTEPTYNVKGVANNRIGEIQWELTQLWNDQYQYYYRSIYGNDWLSEKIKGVKEKMQKYLDKKKSIIQELEEIFGPNWASIDTTEMEENSYIDYAVLTQELEEVCLYVGGSGKMTSGKIEDYTYSYKGVYNYYYSQLLGFNFYKSTQKSKPLIDLITELKKEQNILEQELYRDYQDIISETHYSDTTQITDDGLYAAAYKQFLTYQQPTKSYSSTYITNYDLEEHEEVVEIGDVIELQHDHLKEVLDTKSFIVTVDYREPIKEVLVRYINPTVVNGAINYDKEYMENAVFKQDQNKLFIKMNKNLNFDIEKSIIKEIYINGSIYNSYDYNSVKMIEKVYKSEPVRLRVTGVSKDLRSKLAQLTVEENTLYNTLVDRLIYFLQG